MDEVVEGAGAFPIMLTSGGLPLGAEGHLLCPGCGFAKRGWRFPDVV